MTTYAATVFGWMTVMEAPSKRDALRIAKARAPGASLLPSDVSASHIREATEEDIAWHNSMNG